MENHPYEPIYCMRMPKRSNNFVLEIFVAIVISFTLHFFI